MSSEARSGSNLEAVADYRAALARTDALIDRSPPPKTPEAVRARAESRLARLRQLLAALGDPQTSYPIIHIAGTSGKGSTAVAAASILSHAGLHTGLHTSPYLQAATEKLQVDGRLMDGTTFRKLVDDVLDAASNGGIGPVTYGEVWFALVALTFKRARVDIAVVEVGAGGRFDLTNVVTPAVSVITSIGLDHTETLGSTIPGIAWHKAGIIKPGIPVVSAVTDRDALPVIEHEAVTQGSLMVQVVAGQTFDLELAGEGRYRWWETNRPDERFVTAMPGRFQAVNAATALAAIRAIPGINTSITPQAIRSGLSAARLPGRFELVQTEPAVILDGAHNPQKMASLASDVAAWRGRHPGARVIVLFGVLASKDHGPMLAELTDIADELVTSSPLVLAKPGADAASLAAAAADGDFPGMVTPIDDPDAALDRALSSAESGDLVLVTGSLYLVGNVRKHWFPDDEIVIQRTSWPTAQLRSRVPLPVIQ